MDHHDNWDQWSGDEHGLGDADTADLDQHLGDAGGHDHLGDYGDLDDQGHDDQGHDDQGHDDLEQGPGHDDLGHDDLGQGPGHDLSPAPDLLHDGDLDHAGSLDHEGDLDAGGPHDLDAGDHHDVDVSHDMGDEPHHGHLVGADPDLPAEHHGLHDGDFPPSLDLDHRPDPTDGYPWADPDTLGDPGPDPTADPASVSTYGGAQAGDLLSYAGMEAPPPGVDPWQHLLGSDDPATSTLARWWGPLGG